MKDLRKRVAYLRGLMDGLQVNTASNEGRILAEVVGILEEMADGLVDLYTSQTELEDYVESVDEDLSDLQDEFDAQDIETDEDTIEVECPSCHDVVYFDPDILDEEDAVVEVTCPNCGTVVFSTEENAPGQQEEQPVLASEKTEEK